MTNDNYNNDMMANMKIEMNDNKNWTQNEVWEKNNLKGIIG